MRLFLALTFLIIFGFTQGQEKYWIMLSDKEGVCFDPQTYFDAKTIQKRIRQGIPLDQESDRPLRADYLDQISTICDTVTGHSRWFNAVAGIISTEEQKSELMTLPFVLELRPMVSTNYLAEQSYDKLKEGQKGLIKSQISWMRGEAFTKAGITGKGVRICIIDAGFPGVNTAKEFSHIRKNKGIIATWDFHKNRSDVYDYHTHGSTVLSCIAGLTSDSVSIGLATDAEFLLARTELILREGLSEEEDWLMAVEWADKNGADIINSSLGYTTSLYFKENMDGQTALITRAGNIAASKGILVVNAAGNEGDGYWKYIAAPADADSVLTVGGINPWTGIHTSFSSYGPTADFRMKPNVSAFGHVMAYGYRDGIHETQGTSFSSPLVAGFAACVLQNDSSLSTMDLFHRIEQASHLYPYFDYAHGFGVPSAESILRNGIEVADSTIRFELTNDSIHVHIIQDNFRPNDEVVINYHSRFFRNKSPSNMHIPDAFISDDSNTKLNQPNYIYYHIEDRSGVLEEYALVAPRDRVSLVIPIYGNIGKTLRVWYQGFMNEMVLEIPKAAEEEEENDTNDQEEKEDDNE